MKARDKRKSLLKYISAMQNVKALEHLPVFHANTFSMAAKYFEVPEKSLYHCSCYKSGEMKDYGVTVKTYFDFADNGYIIEKAEGYNGKKIATYGDFKLNIHNRGLTIFPDEAMFIFALSLQESRIAHKIRIEIERMQVAEKLGTSQETVREYNQNQSSNQIQVFENAEFGEIRTLMIDDEPWFVGKDVAEVLGYGNGNKSSKAIANAIKDHVDEDDKKLLPYEFFKGYQNGDLKNISHYGAMIINESGLYSLILLSKLPTAKKFKHWVTAEILPSLRKHGAYMTPETIERVLYNPDFLIKIANTLKAEQEKNRKLLVQKQELQTENQELKTTNKALLGEIQKWDYKPLITKLIRVYSSKAANGMFGVGWNHYYDELLYKYSINLKTRKTKSKTSKSCLDFISQDEVEIAVKVAIAMCESSGIKTNDILNRYR